MVNEAQDAEGVGAGKAMMALEGLVGGLFLVLLILVVMDVARAPIKSREEVEKLFGLPALNPRASGDLGGTAVGEYAIYYWKRRAVSMSGAFVGKFGRNLRTVA